MRDDVLASLVDRALNDDEFRRRAQADLEGTLREYGYELEPDELAAVTQFHVEAAGRSEAEFQELLASGAGRRGGA